MKKFLSNISFMTAFASSVVAVSFFVSIHCKDFMWFARSGSIVVGIGIALLARTTLVNRDLLPTIISAETRLNVNSLEHIRALKQLTPDYVKNDSISRRAIGVVGPIISFIGTVIWGYGDLLNHLMTNTR